MSDGGRPHPSAHSIGVLVHHIGVLSHSILVRVMVVLFAHPSPALDGAGIFVSDQVNLVIIDISITIGLATILMVILAISILLLFHLLLLDDVVVVSGIHSIGIFFPSAPT